MQINEFVSINEINICMQIRSLPTKHSVADRLRQSIEDSNYNVFWKYMRRIKPTVRKKFIVVSTMRCIHHEIYVTYLASSLSSHNILLDIFVSWWLMEYFYIFLPKLSTKDKFMGNQLPFKCNVSKCWGHIKKGRKSYDFLLLS